MWDQLSAKYSPLTSGASLDRALPSPPPPPPPPIPLLPLSDRCQTCRDRLGLRDVTARGNTGDQEGSLSYHRRYKRRLVDAPEEKPELVLRPLQQKAMLQWSPAQLPYQVCSHLHLTSVASIQAEIRFWLVPISYATTLSYRKDWMSEETWWQAKTPGSCRVCVWYTNVSIN